MTPADIQALIEENPKLMEGAELVETHISWVILTEKLAYKIKKPVQFSFLDFSTLEKRKYYCGRELFLNRRITSNVYLEVLPVYRKPDQTLSLEVEEGELIDYALKMRRLDNNRQMNILLEKDQVTKQQLDQLAEMLANFHISAETVTRHPNLRLMQQDFSDITKVSPYIEKHWGADSALLIHQSVAYSQKTLNDLEDRIYERHLEGYTVDGHGDLHARNIFLLEKPVIFDCIEFDDHLRKLDVLNELAFLCMDLDYYDQPGLGKYLLDQYNKRYVTLTNTQDESLFHYFKLYRANVRLKVSTLDSEQHFGDDLPAEKVAVIENYLSLYRRYLEEV